MKTARERFYRSFESSARWNSFRIKVETTDLYIRASRLHERETTLLIEETRKAIREHIEMQPDFLTSLKPVPRVPGAAPLIARMYEAGEKSCTGPMSSVAGIIAETVGRSLMHYNDEVIVENGGDNWMSLQSPASIAVYAGTSVFTGRIALSIDETYGPVGVCTSSGRVGHSLSFGKADSVTVISPDAALADAVATGACNIVQDKSDLERALDYACSIEGILGALIIFRDSLAARGMIEIVDPTAPPSRNDVETGAQHGDSNE